MRDRRKNILRRAELNQLAVRITDDGGDVEAIEYTGSLQPDFALYPIGTKTGKLYSAKRTVKP